jgi:hypothetical protein
MALSKAYNGNLGALTRLGVPLDASIIATKDFNAAQTELTRLFGGAAKANTETYAGQLAIVTERFGEMKESIGVALLPTMKTLLEQVNMVAKGFSGDDPNGLSARAVELGASVGDSGAYSLGTSIRALSDSFTRLFTALTSKASADSTSALEAFAGALEKVANAINVIAGLKGKVKDFQENTSLGRALTALDNFVLGGTPGNRPVGGRAAGGSIMPGGVYRVGEFGPETFVSAGASGSIRPDNGAGQGVTIIMNGVIDGESARRSIERLLQDSSRRTGAINLVGATL